MNETTTRPSLADSTPPAAPVTPFPAVTTPRQPEPRAADRDPVGSWILELRRLGNDAFSVLFAIHTLRGRRRGSSWIARSELCRSANLDPVQLGAAIRELEARGVLRVYRDARKPDWARYLLIIR